MRIWKTRAEFFTRHSAIAPYWPPYAPWYNGAAERANRSLKQGVEHVDTPQTDAELAAVRRCVQRGRPFGAESWTARAVDRLGLESTVRPRGRPKKRRIGS